MADIAARIAGKWRIIETAIWDKQHLDLCGPAFIEFDTQGQGEMAFGALQASIEYGFNASGIEFDWSGADEGDQAPEPDGQIYARTAASKAKSPITTVTKLPSSQRHGRVFQQTARGNSASGSKSS